MTFTALHRAVGAEPGPITNELLDEAVAQGVQESTDLDWKAELPPGKELRNSDFPKDVAAMANAGGGVIVFGVTEREKVAQERVDAGDLDEVFERTMRAVAVSAITPPVLGLRVHRVDQADRRAVVVEVPASSDGPHLIYRGEYFGTPVRNDADTVWMKEQQIEAMYRARFDARRHTTDELDALYSDAARGRGTDLAWLVAVAHPRTPRAHVSMTRERASEVFRDAEVALSFLDNPRAVPHPLENVDRFNPRPGLRRWVAPNTAQGERQRWKETWASIHRDGSVTLATALSGRPTGMVNGDFEFAPSTEIESSAFEFAVADFMGLLRSHALATSSGEYDVRVGIEWGGSNPLTVTTVDAGGFRFDGSSTPLHGFTPVEMSVDASGSDSAFLDHVRDLARDCANQGGLSTLRFIKD